MTEIARLHIDEPVGWIRLLKCGTGSTTTYLTDLGGFYPFYDKDLPAPDDRAYVAAVRRPFGRWLAACRTMSDSTSPATNERMHHWRKYVSKISVHHASTGKCWTHHGNEHFHTQQSRLEPFPNSTLIPLPHWDEELPRWLSARRVPAPPFTQRLNVTGQGYLEQAMSVFTPDDRAIVEAHYACDMELLS